MSDDQCSSDAADPYCLDAITPAEAGLEPASEDGDDRD